AARVRRDSRRVEPRACRRRIACRTTRARRTNMQVLKQIGARLAKGGYLIRATLWAAVLGVIELVQNERGRRILAVLSLAGLTAGFVYLKPVRPTNSGDVGVAVNAGTGHIGRAHEGW